MPQIGALLPLLEQHAHDWEYKHDWLKNGNKHDWLQVFYKLAITRTLFVNRYDSINMVKRMISDIEGIHPNCLCLGYPRYHDKLEYGEHTLHDYNVQFDSNLRLSPNRYPYDPCSRGGYE